MNKPVIYLCGPISGLTWEEATRWRIDVTKRLNGLCTILSPLRNKEKFLKDVGVIEGAYEHLLTTPDAVVTRDLFDVRQADALLVYNPPSYKMSIGTPFEMGYAAALQKPIIVVLHPDDPLRKHPFILDLPFGVVVASIREAITYLLNLFNLSL
jgi:nucleoside 2-deoxyribosyltransferase